MPKRDEPTLLGAMWQKIEPTIMTEGASQTERIQLRTAFLSGANAMLVTLTRAKKRGGGRVAMQTLEKLCEDLKQEAGSRWVGARLQ
jgi:hypothetical protein